MRTITGLFDSRPDAERAVEYLVQHHDIDRNAIQVHAAGSENVTAGTHERRDESHHGFVVSLDALGLPEEDHVTYAEGMRRGGIMVSVRVPESRLDAVADAFESNGAVDLDARAADWRQGGWAGGGGGLIGGKAAGSSATPDSMPAVNPDAAQAGWTGGGSAIGSTAARGEGSDQVHSTYAGTNRIGARGTEEDITRPVNAGIASSPPVRPAGPAALAAAGAGASLSAIRGSAEDARRAASVGFDGPGTGAGPAPGSAAAGAQPLPERGGPADAGSPTPQTTATGRHESSQRRSRVRSYAAGEPPRPSEVQAEGEHRRNPGSTPPTFDPGL
ncbi:hypothetical protein [Roseicella aquatilis]|uniref:General stress protein 17M-like domain-containing protein n=1 Tax=Roseicella aquatilis TaxID=2527868 RepID=A0A4R4DS55_9PROT|nr:hypothetical protein [Roseicella aquatilis]TCZ64388.1 hypothetical protein EXY23_07005 [Roseicella aquatilis]